MGADIMLDGVIIPGSSELAHRFSRIAAQTTRFRDWPALSSYPMTEGESFPTWERDRTRGRLEFAIRNDPYCAALHNTFKTHVGHASLRAKSKDKAYNATKEALWLEWSESCEVSGLSIEELLDVIHFELLVSGEVFFLKLANGQLQLIPSRYVFSESERGGRERQGIVYSSTNIPEAYRIGYLDESGKLICGEKTVPASQVIHLYLRDRAEMGRSAGGWLIPALPAIQDVAELVAAKIMQVKVQSHLSAAIIKNGGGGAFPTLANTGNVKGDDTGADATKPRPTKHAKISSGTILYLEPGEDIKTIQPNILASDFDQFVIGRLRAIGGSIGMPLEIYVLGFSQSNYSSARATHLDWSRKVRNIRELIERRFLRPVNLWFSERQRAANKLTGDRSLDKECSWGWPSMPSIDEKVEAEANILKLKAGLTTHTEIYAQQGGAFWEDEVRQRARDVRAVLDAAAAEKVDPRLIVPDLFAGVPATPATPPAPTAAPTLENVPANEGEKPL